MYFLSGGDIGFRAKRGGTFGNVSAAYNITQLDKWYHVAWTYNSTTGGQLYVDGVAVGAKTGSGLLSVYYAYDDNSQLVGLRDDNGTVTAYFYDNLNRQLVERKGLYTSGTSLDVDKDNNSGTTDDIITLNFTREVTGNHVTPQDTETNGTDITLTYDEDSLVTERTDEAGNVLTYTYDGLHRREKMEVTTQASGFVGTEEQTFKYDGLGRRTESFDDNNGTTSDGDDVICTWAYDSLSRIVEETQKIGSSGSTRAVTCYFDAASGSVSRDSSVIYPDGRRVDNTYDNLDRLLTRKDNGETNDIGTYEYLGAGRVAVLTYQNDTRLTHLTGTAASGFDNMRRTINHRWEKINSQAYGSGALLVGFEHQDSSGTSLYDRAHNKLIEYKSHDPANSEMYKYDSAYRLTDPSSSTQNGFQRGTFDDGDRDSMSTENVNYYEDWQLDGLGNWPSVWKNSTTALTRTHSDFNEIVSDGANTLTHDKNGNLTDDGTVTIELDALNRIKEVTRKSPSETLAEYVYDADNRRMEKIVQNGGILDDAMIDGTTRYYYHGWRVVEEYSYADSTETLERQFTYGNYLDEVWTIDDRNGVTVAQLNDTTGSQRHFAHANTLYHVYGLTDEGGNLVEGYQYDAYGKTTVFTGKGADSTWFTLDDTTANWSAKANPYQYTGQRYDPETGLYYYKNRYYDTNLGRFITRDPIGYEDSLNLYEYVLSRPVLYLDTNGNFPAVPVVVGGVGVVALKAAAAALGISVAACLADPECRALAVKMGNEMMDNLENNVKYLAKKAAEKSRQYLKNFSQNLRNQKNKDPKCDWPGLFTMGTVAMLMIIDNTRDIVTEILNPTPPPGPRYPQIGPEPKPRPKKNNPRRPRPRTFPPDPPYDPRRPYTPPHINRPYY